MFYVVKADKNRRYISRQTFSLDINFPETFLMGALQVLEENLAAFFSSSEKTGSSRERGS